MHYGAANISRALQLNATTETKLNRLHFGMGVYFFEKSLSFLSRVQLVVFEIMKLPPKYGQKL